MNDVYLTKEFARQARRSGVSDAALIEAVDRVEAGHVDADLGGGLVKQRVARPGKGRSGGFRTVIAYRKGSRAIFLHMFAKNAQANLSALELEALKEIAKPLLKLSDKELKGLVQMRGWREIEKSKDDEGREEGLS